MSVSDGPDHEVLLVIDPNGSVFSPGAAERMRTPSGGRGALLFCLFVAEGQAGLGLIKREAGCQFGLKGRDLSGAGFDRESKLFKTGLAR